MPKKKSTIKIKTPLYHKVMKRHFPLFYEQPLLAIILLLVLIAIFWIMRLGL